jgi:hypothetical protein
MRLSEKRTFKAINFDDADEYLAEGDVRDMLNVRVGYTESGEDGIIENVKGTSSLFSELGFVLPGGTNKCIATCADDQNNRLIWLNYNSNDEHGIYCYNLTSNTITTILASSTLNFSGELIHSIDILDNNLAWVDENRPRAINVTNAIAGVLAGATIEELINDAKVVPMFPPVCTTERTTGVEFIESLKSFQFIYRYVFIDGEKGAWSTVSKLIPTAYRDNHINKITLNISICELFTKTPLRNIITYVEFASRELYTLNFNQFLRIETADLVTAGGIVEYFDTESKTPVDATETNISFYENPIKAGSVCFQNDRKFYADCTEGYDAFNLSPSLSNINVQIVPASGGIPYLSDCDTHVNDRYLKPDSEYGYSIEFHDKYGRKSGAMDLPDLVIRTQEQLSNDYRANVLQFGLNLSSPGSYPEWAEKFEILRSDNKTVTFFVQGRVNTVYYCTGYNASDEPIYINSAAGVASPNVSDTNAIELHIDISNWTQYGTNIGYSWTEGDLLTFFTMGGVTDSNGMQVFKGMKIKELRGSLLIVDYPSAGRTNLNHGQIAATDKVLVVGTTIFTSKILSRFIVGDRGVALYSVIDRVVATQTPPGPQIDTPLTFPFPYTGIAPMGIPATSNNLNCVAINYEGVVNTDSIDLFIVGSSGYFLQGKYKPVSNLFDSWTERNTGISTDINCIENSYIYHDKDNLIMVGDNGVILNYHVPTNTFSPQISGTTENLNWVYREAYSDTLVAVGDNGTVLRTTDAGGTWTQIVIENCQNLNGVYLRDGYGMAVGDEGLMILSTDSGATWEQKSLNTVVNLNSVEADGGIVSEHTAYIAGDNGYLVRYAMASSAIIGSYTPGTTKNINFFQSYEITDSITSFVDHGITIGDLDLLQDADVTSTTFTTYSSDITGIYGSVYLNYRAKLEIYSPKTTSGPTLYYETGDAYPVGANYTFNKGKESDGDVFLIKKDFRGTGWNMVGDLVHSMTADSNNTAGTWDKDHGRPNTVLLYPEKQKRRNIIRYSEKYVQDSRINGLSNFLESSYEPIPNEFGFVRKITPIESVLLINAERESATAYIDQTVFRGTDGSDVAATSDRVINNVRKLAGGFGCTHPESIVPYLGSAYWYSSNKMAVCRYNNSNGIFPISEYKARSYFNNINLSGAVVSGGFEPKFLNFILTLNSLLGAEMVTNGNFASSSDPLLGFKKILRASPFTISDLSNTTVPLLGYNLAILRDVVSHLYIDTVLVVGKTYKISFNITDLTSGKDITLWSSNGVTPHFILSSYTTEGEKSLTFVAGISGLSFYTTSSIASGNVAYITDISIKEVLTTSSETIAFQEGNNRWISKYSFWPERYGWINKEMFSFLNGELWKHNANPHRNKFHGTQYPSQVNVVFNKASDSQKNFTYLSLDSGKLWASPSLTTREGQETFILSGHFEEIQNEWFADIKQDINTPYLSDITDALINGDFMQSSVMNVLLENAASDGTSLRTATLFSNIINPNSLRE